MSLTLVGMWQDVEEKKKNKKKDRKKRKGKKGEEEAEGAADDPKQDQASEASDHARPPVAAEISGIGAEQSGVSAPPSTAKQAKPSLAQPGKNGKQAKGGAQAVEAIAASAPSHPVAPQKGPPKGSAKQDRARMGAPRPADAHAASTAADKAAEEDVVDASEWQSVGTAQRRARRGHKAPNPQPAYEPHQAVLPTTNDHKAAQQQPPPPPPLRGPPTGAGGTRPAAAALARAPAPVAVASQQPPPSRQQARAAGAPAVASVPAPVPQGNVPAPSFADVARPVQDRPAKATKRDAAASSFLIGTARAGSPLAQRAGRADGSSPVGSAAAQPTLDAPRPADMRHAAAHTVVSASQQPASAAPKQQLPVPVPPMAASTVLSGTPATGHLLPAPAAAVPAVPQPPLAPGSTLSALAKTWHPTATSAAPIVGPAAECRGQSKEAAATLQGDEHGVGVRREGGASAAPINAAPAVWRSSLGAHSVDWSFPRTSSGTSLNSLVPPRPPVRSCPCLSRSGLVNV